MFRKITLFIIAGFLSISASAKKDVYYTNASGSDDKISLTPFTGFNFAESFDTDFGSVYMEQGPVYGLSMEYQTNDNIEYELTWQKQVTRATANVYYYAGYNDIIQFNQTSDLAIDYFMVGMNGIKPTSDLISLYGGASAGIVVFTPRATNFEAVVKFTVALKAGVKININEHLGIRLQPQLYLPIQSMGANVFVGSQGSSVGLSGYSTITQFGGIGGLTLTF